MAYLNKVILIGRLTSDPEVRTFSNGGKVAKFGFAVTYRKKNMQTGQYEDLTDAGRGPCRLDGERGGRLGVGSEGRGYGVIRRHSCECAGRHRTDRAAVDENVSDVVAVFGLIVNVASEPDAIVIVTSGEIVPCAPADGLMVKTSPTTDVIEVWDSTSSVAASSRFNVAG